jgi:hypothetical protein
MRPSIKNDEDENNASSLNNRRMERLPPLQRLAQALSFLFLRTAEETKNLKMQNQGTLKCIFLN